MIDIRIGNDIACIWSFYSNSEGERVPYNLEGKDIRIVRTDACGAKADMEFSVLGNAATFTFKGKDQKRTGIYTFTFFENFGQDGMKAVDKIQAFALVCQQEIIENGVIGGGVSSMEVTPLSLETTLRDAIDYNELANKPQINHIVLMGDKTLAELGIASAEDLVTETQRAQEAEQTNATAIQTETGRATAKEAELNGAIDAEETRAKAKEAELGTAINTESQRAQGVEGNLSTAIATETGRATAKEAELATAISNEATRAANAESGLDTRLANVEGKIPSQASSTNQLADKSFVNSSIATATATFRGTSATGLSETQFLAWANGLTKDNNDYVFWNTTDAVGNVEFKRYKYNGSSWEYEYTLNNSSFTAAQWAAINSGLSGTDKAALDAALAFIATFGNIVTHNASEFATAEQGGKADTALQPSALTPYRTSANQDTIDNAIKGRLDTIEAQKASKTELQAETEARTQGDTALATRMDNLGLSVVNGMLCITYNS